MLRFALVPVLVLLTGCETIDDAPRHPAGHITHKSRTGLNVGDDVYTCHPFYDPFQGREVNWACRAEIRGIEGDVLLVEYVGLCFDKQTQGSTKRILRKELATRIRTRDETGIPLECV